MAKPDASFGHSVLLSYNTTKYTPQIMRVLPRLFFVLYFSTKNKREHMSAGSRCTTRQRKLSKGNHKLHGRKTSTERKLLPGCGYVDRSAAVSYQKSGFRLQHAAHISILRMGDNIKIVGVRGHSGNRGEYSSHCDRPNQFFAGGATGLLKHSTKYII